MPSREELQVTRVSPPTPNFADTPVFAPKVETVQVHFAIPSDKGVLLSLQLEVYGQEGRAVYKTPDTDLLTADNTESWPPVVLQWDGSDNQSPRPSRSAAPSGRAAVEPPEEKRPYVNPLRSPYTVRVWGLFDPDSKKTRPLDSSMSSTKKVKPIIGCKAPPKKVTPTPKVTPALVRKKVAVRYHSIKLRLKPWKEALHDVCGVKDGAEEVKKGTDGEKAAWLKCRLNAMACYAGPMDKDPHTDEAGSDFRKAVWRYRAMRGLKTNPADEESPVYKYFKFIAKDEETNRNEAVDWPFCKTATAAHWKQLIDALKDEAPKSLFGKDRPDADKSAFTGTDELKLFIDSNRFYAHGTTEQDERAFDSHEQARGSTAKFDREQEWLSRPWLPLEVKILIENSKGTAEWVPEAVGPVAVKWTWNDREENVPGLASGEPNYVKEYVKAAKDALKPYGKDFHNSRTVVGGLIGKDEKVNARSVFAKLGNFAVAPLDDGVRIRACADLADWLLGKDCVNFGTSTMGGDNYQVEAAVDFEPETNGDELQEFHEQPHPVSNHVPMTDPTGSLKAKSTRLTVWRRVRIATLLKWPERRTGQPIAKLQKNVTLQKGIDDARDLYKPGYVSVEGPECVLDIADLLHPPRGVLGTLAFPFVWVGKWVGRQVGLCGPDEEDFAAAFNRIVSLCPGAKTLTTGTPHLSDPLQFSKEAFLGERFGHEDGRDEMELRVRTGDLVKQFFEYIPEPLHDHVAKARQKRGLKRSDGMILLDMNVYDYKDPWQIGASIGAAGGVASISRTCRFRLPKLIAHELGHTLFFKHWLNASGMSRYDHDQSNTNCMMSYAQFWLPKVDGEEIDDVEDLLEKLGTGAAVTVSEEVVQEMKQFVKASRLNYTKAMGNVQEEEGEYPAIANHLMPDTFDPVFCGKCLLRLRGWNDRAQDEDEQWILPLFSKATDRYKNLDGLDYYARFLPCPKDKRDRLQRDLERALKSFQDHPTQVCEYRLLWKALDLASALALVEPRTSAHWAQSPLREFYDLLVTEFPLSNPWTDPKDSTPYPTTGTRPSNRITAVDALVSPNATPHRNVLAGIIAGSTGDYLQGQTAPSNILRDRARRYVINRGKAMAVT